MFYEKQTKLLTKNLYHFHNFQSHILNKISIEKYHTYCDGYKTKKKAQNDHVSRTEKARFVKIYDELKIMAIRTRDKQKF